MSIYWLSTFLAIMDNAFIFEYMYLGLLEHVESL